MFNDFAYTQDQPVERKEKSKEKSEEKNIEKSKDKSKKKSKAPIIIAIILVILLAGGVTAFFLLRDSGGSEPAAPTETVEETIAETAAATESVETQAESTEADNRITMIDVSGKKYSDAASELKAMGLKVEAEYESSDTVAKDYVIRQSIQEGRTLNKGDTVMLFVSSGKQVATEAEKATEEPATEQETASDTYDVESEVETIRGWYYATQDYPGQASEIDGVTYYATNGQVNKIVCPSGNSDVNYSRMYYFHDGKLYFAFIYDDSNEHRLYYKDDVLIRYIDENGTVTDYGSIDCPFDSLAKTEAYTLLNKF